MDSPVIVVAQPSPPDQAELAAPQQAEAAVEVAKVQADRDVAIANIQAGTEIAVQGAITERAALTEDEEVEWLREELAALRQRCETNEDALSGQQAALLTMQEQQQVLIQQMTELVALTQTRTPEPPPIQELPSSPQEAPPGPNEGAPPAAEPTRDEQPPAKGRRKRVLFG